MPNAIADEMARGDGTVPTPDGKLRKLPPATLRSRVDPSLLPRHLAELAPGARLDEIERRVGRHPGLRYLAWALPEREAVWWACMCVLCLSEWDDARARVIDAARAWVRRPDEPGREAMLGLAREAGATSPAGHVGRAAFVSRIEDADSLRAGLSVAGAVEGTLATLPELRRADAAMRFRSSALDIAAGGAGWIDGARRG